MIDRKAITQMREAYGLFSKTRNEIKDVALRGYYAFGSNLSGQVSVYPPAGPVVTDSFLGQDIIVNSITRKGALRARGMYSGRAYIADTREVVVDFHYPDGPDTHQIAVLPTGNALVDDRMVVPQNFGMPLPFKGDRARKNRIVTVARDADTGLAVADTVDSVSAKLLGSRNKKADRLILEATLVDFSAGVIESMLEDR